MKKQLLIPSRLLKQAAFSIAAAAAMFALTESTRAQQIYLQNFNTDDSANWKVNFSYTAGTAFNAVSNNLVNFNFDYTTAGIPIAPHSAQFGSDTIHRGLKLSAVYTNATSGTSVTPKGSALTAGLSVSPTNFSVTANFVMHADMWVNVNCGAYATNNTNNVLGASYATSPHNGTASTVLYGCGYGTAGNTATTPGVTDAIFVGATTDNGSSAMMRIYGPAITPVNAQSSLQDFTFQSTGTVTPGFPGDPYVYNSIGTTLATRGTRSWVGSTAAPPFTTATNLATGQSWAKYFPPSAVPLAQQIAYPQQTNNVSCPGLPTFGWHDVSVEKVGNVIIYKIDGNIIATGDYAVCGTPTGSFLTFMASRTSLTVANAVTGNNYTNLNFAVFANIVVSNYDNVVNVSAPVPTCDEAVPGSPGVFTISRSSAGVPLTVNYTLTGTATNGVQYTTLPTSVTFAASATETNISVFPINDGIPNPTMTVLLTLQTGAGYQGAGSAIVNILDGNTPTIDITSAANAQAYGRYTNSAGPGNNADFISYTLTRRGKLTTGSDLNVNLSYNGSAGPGDFVAAPSVTIPDGAQTATLKITPVDNTSITTNRTVTIGVTFGPGYAIGNGPASGTIVSAHYVATPVLLSNDLTSAGDASNWSITYGCGDPENNSTDFSADFGMTLASAAGGIAIPPPPNGNANALHLTCNKIAGPSSPGAVNAYYTNLFLSGDYAVRFNMNIIEGQLTGNSTEGAIFGINHTGSQSNWWYGGGFLTNQTWTSDGIWYYVTAQPGGSSAQGDYAEYTGEGGTNNNAGWTRLATKVASAFAHAFKVNPGPFTCFDGAGGGSQTAGQPANASPALGADASTWSDVEIKQQNNIVTMSINHTPIFTYTNTTVWKSGYLMLGYADPFGSSVGNAEAGVYYANLQVVQLPAAPSVITINSIVINGGNVVVTFTTSSASDTTASFKLQSSGTVNGTYANVIPDAGMTSLGGNQFQATIPYLGGDQSFYRIFHP